MYLRFKYNMKDGLSYTTQPYSVEEVVDNNQGDFLRATIAGRLNNLPVVFDDNHYKYNDIYSVEIIFDDGKNNEYFDDDDFNLFLESFLNKRNLN